MLRLSPQPKVTRPVVLNAPVRLDLDGGGARDATLITLSSHSIMFDEVDASLSTGAALTVRFQLCHGRLAIATGQIIGSEDGVLTIRFIHANSITRQLAADLLRLRPPLRESFLAMVLKSPMRIDMMPLARLSPSDTVSAQL